MLSCFIFVIDTVTKSASPFTDYGNIINIVNLLAVLVWTNFPQNSHRYQKDNSKNSYLNREPLQLIIQWQTLPT